MAEGAQQTNISLMAKTIVGNAMETSGTFQGLENGVPK
jgi:hypothetical protein